ncbi:hypothetical protein [Spartinivicinus poritis]|uniref:Single-stranded DNA-binding protein BPT7 domain-containing protein n=1 Tax=Spartinivicinus poritis TaxID=2994640 RepID=A0ABT5UK14_9GAMM|nr:hypothetical protein [Spartinivicinus sp. A2-2]MDE1465374.1 hypothetical protein [Spartinivicinus sp. A2-2]
MAKETYISPRGTLGPFPRLNKPDTKYNADGEYKAHLTVPAEDAQALLDEINTRYEKYYNEVTEAERKKKKKPKLKLKQADMPFEVEEDEGTVTFKFKMKALVKKKDGTTFNRRPALFDAKKNIIPEDVVIGQGSEVRFATVFYPWYTPTLGVGITLQPDAVRVYKLDNQTFEADADYYGFDDDEEDGFSIEDQAPFDEANQGGESAPDTKEEEDEDF